MKNLILVGCGNVGNSLLKAFVAKQLFNKIIVVEPSLSRAADFKHDKSIQFIPNCKDISTAFQADIIILAIRTPIFRQVIADIITHAQNSIVVSFLPGVNINFLKHYLTDNVKTMRIMPNMAIKIGQSTNLAFSENLDSNNIDDLNKIFSVSGKIIWLQKEEYIELLTPISGSGPSYFILLATILLTEAIKIGIDNASAHNLVKQVLLGSCNLALSVDDLETLLSSLVVTGGIAEAAFKVMVPGFQQTIPQSLNKALDKLREMHT